MITQKKIKLCAENIAKYINMKKEGECVLVTGGFYAHELLEEIGLSLYRNGGLPYISYTSDYYEEMKFQDVQIKAETIEKAPRHYLKLLENIDAYIVIEPLEDPSLRNKGTQEKLDAYIKSRAAFRNILYGFKEEYAPGKKWCYATWPSKKSADYYKVDYDLYERFIVDGMSVPLEEMRKTVKNLGDKFENAKKIYINDENGTDFWVSVEDRTKNLDDGTLSDEQIALGELGGNLPAGEVFFAPHEKQGEGKLFIPLANERYTHKIIKNVELIFKEGKLLIDKVSAETNLDVLINAFKQEAEIDKTNNVPELRTYNVAELGIGCNPIITKPIGYINTDEKIDGSIHLAFGSNKFFGGTSISDMHWDFVSAPKANITVEYNDGSKKIMMENGKLVVN